MFEESFIKDNEVNQSFPAIKNDEEDIHNKCDDTIRGILEYEWEIDGTNDLKNFLYYHHCDYRSYVPYNRVSNDTYKKDGLAAAIKNKNRPAKMKVRTSRNESDEICHIKLAIKDKRKSVNGVKGVWAFADLPYVDISENICYDPFHAFKNVIHYIFDYIEGERNFSNNVRLFCRKTCCHPSIHNISKESKTNETSNSNRNGTNDKVAGKKSNSNSSKKKNSKKKDKEKDNKKKENPPIWELSPSQIKELENKFLSTIILPTGITSLYFQQISIISNSL